MSNPSETLTANPTRELAAIMFSDIAGYTLIMGRDERQAVRALAQHREVLRELLPKFNGRMIGEIGDGTLTSFHSAVDAVNCARQVQAALKDDPEMRLRIGIHVGDVLVTDNTVLGDGVNVASRIHALASPGGICVSERVYDDIRNQPEIAVKDLGEQTLKNVTRPIRVYALGAPGTALGDATTGRLAALRRRPLMYGVIILFAAALLYGLGRASYPALATLARIYVPRLLPKEIQQKIAFCTTSDGVRIAYGTSGKGPPVVIAVSFLTYLEDGMDSPTYNSAFLKPLVARHTVIQYDGRGFGMSDRGLKDYSVEARVRDLEAVVDAAKLDRFALYGISAGSDVVVAYTARHPDRVTRIVLYGGSPNPHTGPKLSPEEAKTVEAFVTLIENGWGADSIRELNASVVMPDATEVDRRFFSELGKASATPEDFKAFLLASQAVDVTSLAAQIRTPTLVMQTRGDMMNPLLAGKALAALIPGARFVVIEGRDHIPIPGDGENEQIIRIVVPFLDEDLPKARLSPAPL